MVQKYEGGGHSAHLFVEYGATVVTQPEVRTCIILWHLKDLVAIPSLVRKHRSIETANVSRACEGKT